ncbi:hypothetical protein IX317_000366 [Fusobacterium sp. DD29]|uniref:PBSX family phage terminase large subunit n=1 Tax=unclassified Fusobacterium TaxID=2648384 RepID=UPI001B8C17F0|nr:MULTISPECIES: PBSX family phage terminase large subunit [unclassified Fusobacterium]MBR8748707.1 hypothetical protein [Fusobacterium sp. DD29]MBR8760941.1 hypothetical protein [Fusobacterium sp. DD25]MBR8766986.1 hypothetical protein [Fusobacterium sp. DD43]MBR8770987.1 hypothetical protein [Fusobacterium sp. DD40]MBR8775262.1 hypothetical protein [Fusobacterium sp. DD17]
MTNNIKLLYTDKQIEALKSTNKNFWVLIQHGAKRAGKTISNNDLFLMELIRVRKIADKLKVKDPQYILAGNSLGTLERNVLIEITNKYGIRFKFDKFNRFKLFGVLVCCFGHGTIKDLERIRGMTSYGAYINEITTSVEAVSREIFNRCSGEGARLLIDTNPEHWVKKELVDKADGEKIISIHYTLEDNTFLSPRYIENIKFTTPSGQFYDRDIRGLWVNAEGTVYADFDKEKMTVKTVDRNTIVRYLFGVDWGYEHPGAISVIGIDNKGNYILLETHKKQHKEIDYWVQVARDIKTKYGNYPFYCDGARPEHLARFIREGFNASNARKEILSGIECIATLIKTGRFYVLESCKPYFDEVYSYVWDTKSGLPIKVNDDVQDSIRYAIYTDYITKLDVGAQKGQQTNYFNNQGFYSYIGG